MTTKFMPVLVASFVSILTSCSADSTGTTLPAGPCKADAAQALVGKPKPTDAEALQLTNSKSVRQIEPGQMVTQDFRDDRITIETDPATGRVVGARCG
jgi:hypothetical protein